MLSSPKNKQSEHMYTNTTNISMKKCRHRSESKDQLFCADLSSVCACVCVWFGFYLIKWDKELVPSGFSLFIWSRTFSSQIWGMWSRTVPGFSGGLWSHRSPSKWNMLNHFCPKENVSSVHLCKAWNHDARVYLSDCRGIAIFWLIW